MRGERRSACCLLQTVDCSRVKMGVQGNSVSLAGLSLPAPAGCARIDPRASNRCGSIVRTHDNEDRCGMGDVLVTGASGFVGFHFVQALVAHGDRVTCLVRKTSASTASNVWASKSPAATLPIGRLCGPRWPARTSSTTSPAAPRPFMSDSFIRQTATGRGTSPRRAPARPILRSWSRFLPWRRRAPRPRAGPGWKQTHCARFRTTDGASGRESWPSSGLPIGSPLR